jgi:hypothetical protein
MTHHDSSTTNDALPEDVTPGSSGGIGGSEDTGADSDLVSPGSSATGAGTTGGTTEGDVSDGSEQKLPKQEIGEK